MMKDSAKSRSRHPLLRDRTPLFVGVVLIPLAAGYVFGPGVLGAGQFLPRHEHHSSVELRGTLADRERREGERLLVAGEAGDEAQSARVLHGPVPPALVSSEVFSVVVPSAPPFDVVVSGARPASVPPAAGRAPPRCAG